SARPPLPRAGSPHCPSIDLTPPPRCPLLPHPLRCTALAAPEIPCPPAPALRRCRTDADSSPGRAALPVADIPGESMIGRRVPGLVLPHLTGTDPAHPG